MPFVRIDTVQGHYSDAQREAIGQAVQLALHEIGVPAAERFQIFSERLAKDLIFDTSYMGINRTNGFLAVQITLNTGRTTADKKRLYAALADRLSALAGVLPGDLFVNLVEVVRDNWSFGNGEAQFASQ